MQCAALLCIIHQLFGHLLLQMQCAALLCITRDEKEDDMQVQQSASPESGDFVVVEVAKVDEVV